MTSLEVKAESETFEELPDASVESVDDPTIQGQRNAAEILEHFEQFAKGEPDARFKPCYFLRSDVLGTMPAVFGLLTGNEVGAVPTSSEPIVINEINGVVLAIQTGFANNNTPIGDSMWAQFANEPLQNPFLPPEA